MGFFILIAVQCFFMYKGISTIPYFILYVWAKAPQKQPIDVILLKTPSGYFNTNKLSQREQEMLLNYSTCFCNCKRKKV